MVAMGGSGLWHSDGRKAYVLPAAAPSVANRAFSFFYPFRSSWPSSCPGCSASSSQWQMSSLLTAPSMASTLEQTPGRVCFWWPRGLRSRTPVSILVAEGSGAHEGNWEALEVSRRLCSRRSLLVPVGLTILVIRGFNPQRREVLSQEGHHEHRKTNQLPSQVN